jgi:hypothetical protein
MVTVLPAKDLTLAEVLERFDLEEVTELDFFPEWQDPLPELSEEAQRWLSREAQLNIKRRERPSPQPSPKVGEGARVRFPFSYFGRRG